MEHHSIVSFFLEATGDILLSFSVSHRQCGMRNNAALMINICLFLTLCINHFPVFYPKGYKGFFKMIFFKEFTQSLGLFCNGPTIS